MGLLERGLTNAEIADRLGVSLDGAKYHVREILGKLGADSREEAVEVWRAMPSRPGRWRFALSALIAGKAAVGALVVVVAVAVGAGAVALVARDDDKTPSNAASDTPLVPAPTATSTPSATDLAHCTDQDVTLRIEAVPEVDHHLVRLFADGATPCRLLGPMELGLIRPPVDPAPAYPPEANVARTFKTILEFPFSGQIGEWRWENWCAPLSPWVAWSVRSATDDGPRTQLPNDAFPPCTSDGEPTTLAVARFFPGVDGDVIPDRACLDAGLSSWLCELANSVALDSVGSRPDLFPTRISNNAFFLCDGNGSAPGLGDSDICVGKAADQSVRGYWLATPSSPGRFVSQAAFEDAVEAALPPSEVVSGVGCRAGDDCSRFVIVVGGHRLPAIALLFELESGREPAIRGAVVLEGEPPPGLSSPFGEFTITPLPPRP